MSGNTKKESSSPFTIAPQIFPLSWFIIIHPYTLFEIFFSFYFVRSLTQVQFQGTLLAFFTLRMDASNKFSFPNLNSIPKAQPITAQHMARWEKGPQPNGDSTWESSSVFHRNMPPKKWSLRKEGTLGAPLWCPSLSLNKSPLLCLKPSKVELL